MIQGINYGNLGINYGHQYLSGKQYNEIEVKNDLTWIWNHGFRKIRIGGGDLGNVTPLLSFWSTRFNIYKQIAIDAKTMGFYVVFPVTGTSGLNDTTWSTYVTNVEDAADTMWNSGSPLVDEFQVGNELELINSGPSDLQTKIKALGTSVRSSHFMADGISTFVSYAFAQGYSSAWITAGIGDFDRLDHHAYNSGSGSYDAELKNLIAAFGADKIYCGEWNVHSNWPFTSTNNVNTCENTIEENQLIYTRLKKLKALGIDAYFFTYRWDQANNQFGLFDASTGTYRKWTDVLCGNTPIKETDKRRKNTLDHGYTHDSSNAARRLRRSGTITGMGTGSPYTLSIWIKPNSFSGAPRILDWSGTGGVNIQLSGSKILMALSTSTGAKINNLSTDDLNLKLGEWNHVIWRDNLGDAVVYVNGVRGLRNFRYTQTGTIEANIAAIGIERINNYNNFNGLIDELAIYPKALSLGEIRQLYEQGNSNLGDGVAKSLYLKLDEGSGLTAADDSGNGYNFTLESATGAWVARPAEILSLPSINRSKTTTRSRQTRNRANEDGSVYSPVWSGLGFSIGHDSQNGVSTYQSTQNNISKIQQFRQDLHALRAMGIKKLRLAMNDYSYTAGVDLIKTFAIAAKDYGFYVVWGVDNKGGFGAQTEAGWGAFVKGVEDAADWAESNGIDEFQIANEIEFSETAPIGSNTDPVQNIVQKLKDLAEVVKRDHFSRTVSCAIAQNSKESEWISTGKGSLDRISYNVYGSANAADNFLDWKNKITALYNKFGSSMDISEWNTGLGAAMPGSEAEQATEISNRITWLAANCPDITAYFFNYRWQENNNYLALMTYADGQKAWFDSLFTT